jgi:hypothetical protein
LEPGTGMCKSSAGKRQLTGLIGFFSFSHVSVRLSPCEICGGVANDAGLCRWLILLPGHVCKPPVASHVTLAVFVAGSGV